MFKVFFLFTLCLTSVFAEDIGGFEIRLRDPKLDLPPLVGSTSKETDQSKVRFKVRAIVDVTLDLQLDKVKYSYDFKGVSWRSGILRIEQARIETFAEQIKVIRQDVNVDIIGRNFNKDVVAKKPQKNVTLVSTLTRPVELPLPKRIEVNIAWKDGKPVVSFVDAQAVKKEFADIARDLFLPALKTENKMTEWLDILQRDKANSSIEFAVDKMPVLRAVLESILNQVSPTLQMVTKNAPVTLVVEHVGNDWCVYPKGKTCRVSREVEDLFTATAQNNIFVILDTNRFNQNLASLGEKNPMLIKDVAQLKMLARAMGETLTDKTQVSLSWQDTEAPYIRTLTENKKQYLDLHFVLKMTEGEAERKKPIRVRFELREHEAPHVLGFYNLDEKEKQILSSSLLATVINTAIQKQKDAVTEVRFLGSELRDDSKTIVVILKLISLAVRGG